MQDERGARGATCFRRLKRPLARANGRTRSPYGEVPLSPYGERVIAPAGGAGPTGRRRGFDRLDLLPRTDWQLSERGAATWLRAGA